MQLDDPARFGTGPLGLAVSGGGDSMAMLHLAAQVPGLQVSVVSVDHGLRAESAAEAAMVARVCAGLGVPHSVLRWHGWDRRGNLQAEARRARYGLMAQWARAAGLSRIALAHTQDDQAETFLMRLARRAGVDGLAAMEREWQADGVTWSRPLLDVPRADLRRVLQAGGVPWVDDPSNDDPHYTRVQARRVLAALAPLGIDAATLSDVAQNLSDARDLLQAQVCLAARACARTDAGDVVLESGAFAAQPPEVQRRLLEAALKWVASADYGPRAESLAEFGKAVAARRAATLHGCRLCIGAGVVRVTREWQAVRDCVAPAGTLWDGRWEIFGQEINGLQVRPLGAAGLAQVPDWRALGRPRASQIAAPALWQDDRLVAAPLAGWPNGWQAAPRPDPAGIFLSILSH